MKAEGRRQKAEVLAAILLLFLLPSAFSLLTATAPTIYRVQIDTGKGSFLVEVDRRWAPRGADRFYELVCSGFYDDSRFFRVRRGFVAQFGIAGDPRVTARWRGKTVVDDRPQQSNVRGTIAFAMTGPNTRLTQVYINLVDNRRLDADRFVPFGRVVSGMDVVDRLYSGYGENAGGGMRGGKQQPLLRGGNAYLDRNYPKLERLQRASVVFASR